MPGTTPAFFRRAGRMYRLAGRTYGRAGRLHGLRRRTDKTKRTKGIYMQRFLINFGTEKQTTTFAYDMEIRKKMLETLVLLAYVAVVTAVYWTACKLMHKTFGELELLYSAAVGCLAYVPRMIRRYRKGE